MKNLFVKTFLLLAMGVAISITATAQFVVKIKPHTPSVVRAIAPSPRHIWIDGEWIWRGGGYQYVTGYWAIPPRYGRFWVPGHWKQSRRGWIWKPGHWRRR